MKPKREEGPGWGPGLLNSAWWEHAPCVGGFKIRSWVILVKDQKRISKCRWGWSDTLAAHADNPHRQRWTTAWPCGSLPLSTTTPSTNRCRGGGSATPQDE